MSHKGLDCYLDSLFDPVLSYGDAVRIGGGAWCVQTTGTARIYQVVHTSGVTAWAMGWHISSGSLLGTQQRMRVSSWLERFLDRGPGPPMGDGPRQPHSF